MGWVRIVDQSGACHDEARLWSEGNRRGDQISHAIEIGSPGVILIILSPENRGNRFKCGYVGILMRSLPLLNVTV